MDLEKALRGNDSAAAASTWTTLDDVLARVDPDRKISSILVALGHYAVTALAVTENGYMPDVQLRLFYSQAPKDSLEDRVAHIALILVPEEDGRHGRRGDREQRAAQLITNWTRPDQIAVDELRLVLASGFFTARLLARALDFNPATFHAWLDGEYRLVATPGDDSPSG
jgi:hypothetical protein